MVSGKQVYFGDRNYCGSGNMYISVVGVLLEEQKKVVETSLD
jgi:hypothetical protein